MEHTIDYQEVGLMVGLEVHQQLLTDRKMFCHCPAGRYTKVHDGVVLRHMRPTLSELGEYDRTALMEFKTKKNIIYLLHKSNVCTYEMDDTPPFLLNQQALDVAIEQCLMLGCDIVDEVHVARKQYLDGSIPTGFQRTAIVGVNGQLPLRDRKLSIVQVSVEEDSCREVSDKGHLIVWRTDRLGMPLIETVTGPDLRTPDEVEEAILLVGRVCRSTGHVRVGMGASRQDVNVSVRGGTRVEIKGVPRASWAPKLVHGEAVRQVNLLRLRDELHQRGFKCRDDIRIEQAEVTYLFENSQLSYLRQQEWDKFVEQEGRRPGFELGQGPFGVRAIKLTGLAGVLSWPTQPDHIFAHELAGRIRVIAGLDQQPILLHSEKWPDYVDAQRELRKVKKRLGAGSHDAIIVVWGPQEDTLAAAEEVRLRLIEATEGIPPETRQPFADGSTDFERVLPGPDRMYPDTDSPPIGMTRERVERLKARLPPPPWVREQQYRDKGIAKETIYYLIRRGGASLVDKVVQECQADLRQACYFFGERIKGLARKEQRVKDISIEQWCDFFKATALRPAITEAWQQITLQVAESPHIPMRQVLENLGLINTSGNSGWQLTMLQILQNSRPTYDDGSWERRFRFYMGQIMKELRGKVPARDVVAALKEKLEPTLTNSLAGIEKHPSFIPDITA